jgi:hypothetical protein
MPSGNDKRFQKFKGHKRRRHGNVKNPLSTPATPPNPNAPTACRWAAQGFYGIIALTFPYRRDHIPTSAVCRKPAAYFAGGILSNTQSKHPPVSDDPMRHSASRPDRKIPP